jgi:hypothetical protein
MNKFKIGLKDKNGKDLYLGDTIEFTVLRYDGSMDDIADVPTTGKIVLKKYRDTKFDGRFFVNQVPLSSEDFLRETEDFLKANTDKKLVMLDLDHAGLLKAKNDNKKLAIDDMVEGLYLLKNKYHNFAVALLTQANRSVRKCFIELSSAFYVNCRNYKHPRQYEGCFLGC